MLNEDTHGRMCVIVLFVFLGKWSLFGSFDWKCSTRMESLYSLKSRVSTEWKSRMQTHATFFVHTHIMPTTNTHCYRNDDSSFRNEKLSFERVTFLFPRIVMFLLVFAPFFCGRSIGLSATSTVTYEPLLGFRRRAFFP